MTTSVDLHLRLLPGIPLVDSPFFDAICASGYFTADEERIARDLNQHGYAILDFPNTDIWARAQRIRQALAPLFADARNSGDRHGGRLMPPRFQDAWEVNEDVAAIANQAALLALLSKLYGRAAFPFQTLNFERGSQQHVHTDAVHFNSYPPAFMCGVWVALEDVTADNGPLMYYPGSHRWAIYDNEQTTASAADRDRPASQAAFHELWNALIAQRQATLATFLPRAGQALIWTANLLHGGAPIIDPHATRWSQVTHYFFDNCAYYRPMASHLLPGEMAFITPLNLSLGTQTVAQFAGEPLDEAFVRQNQQRAELRAQTLSTKLPADFEPALYLQLNQDVANAGADAAHHYVTHGKLEGRRYR